MSRPGNFSFVLFSAPFLDLVGLFPRWKGGNRVAAGPEFVAYVNSSRDKSTSVLWSFRQPARRLGPGITISTRYFPSELQMNGVLVGALFAWVVSTPVLAQAPRRFASADRQALRLFNADEFRRFLVQLDTDAIRWQAQLKAVDIASLGAGQQEQKELEKNSVLCLRAIEHSRSDIKTLLENQSLKDEILLLIDLGELDRDLDRMASALTNPVLVAEPSSAQKAMRYAKEVLSVDRESTAYSLEFQEHVLALAKLVDHVLAQPQLSDGPSRNQKEDQK